MVNSPELKDKSGNFEVRVDNPPSIYTRFAIDLQMAGILSEGETPSRWPIIEPLSHTLLDIEFLTAEQTSAVLFEPLPPDPYPSYRFESHVLISDREKREEHLSERLKEGRNPSIWYFAVTRHIDRPGNEKIKFDFAVHDEQGVQVQYLGNEKRFIKVLQAYAKTYQAVLESLYEERGLPLPMEAVVLK